MGPKVLLSYAGVFLIIAGVVLIAAQMFLGYVDPETSAAWTKTCDVDFHHFKCNTNILGFGVLVVGAILLYLSSFIRAQK